MRSLLRSLPFHRADRIIGVYETHPQIVGGAEVNFLDYQDWQRSIASSGRSFFAIQTPRSSARATLSAKDNRHWFRGKFHQRYGLFYRLATKEKVILYACLNDERTLRKAESKTDPYCVFRGMLETGDPPGSIADLVQRSKGLKSRAE
jgi:hypothetical protein